MFAKSPVAREKITRIVEHLTPAAEGDVLGQQTRPCSTGHLVYCQSAAALLFFTQTGTP
jgi:hypothetical protein